jgi:hypothetical protein
MFGIPASQAAAEGTAQLDLAIAGSWAAWGGGSDAAAFAGPQVTGKAKLHNLRFTLRGTGGPVEILSADMQLAPDQVRVAKLNAKAAGVLWSGSLEMPRGCGTPGACEVHFALRAGQVALRELSGWASPQPKAKPWYRVLEASRQNGPSFFAGFRAAGTLTADRFEFPHVEATHVSADVTLDQGKLGVSSLSAAFLGGRHHGEWQADFSAQPATCSGSGRLSEIPLARLGEATNERWVTGLANGSYQVKGPCSAEFWRAAEGTLQFEVKDGSLAHISLAGDEEPLKISHALGQARLHGGELSLQGVVLNSQTGKFQLSGTASLDRKLDLKLAPTSGSAGYTITGTIAAPQVSPLPRTEQARLKPEAAK